MASRGFTPVSKRALVSYRLLREPSGAWRVQLSGRRGVYRFLTRHTALAFLGHAIALAEPVTA